MSSRSNTAGKRPGFFRQIRSLYTFTRDVYPWLPWALAGMLLLGVGVGVVVGMLIPPGGVWSILLWGFSGVMLGLLSAMMLQTRLATTAMYKKIDGTPGATGHILSTGLGSAWIASDTPVGVNPKTHDAVYRVVGRGGIVIVGEGARGRLTRLVNDEKMKVQRVATGVPIEVIYVGHGEGDVPISRLSTTIKRLPKKIDRATLAAVAKRIDSISKPVTSLPIPKGIDPAKMRAQRPR